MDNFQNETEFKVNYQCYVRARVQLNPQKFDFLMK